MRALLIATTLALIATSTHAQVSCQRIGSQTFCSNGVTSQDIGPYRFYNNVPQQPAAPLYQAPPPVYQPVLPMQPMQPMQPTYPVPYHR